ncbi:uncharacterized protein [Apostichopus japonicus]|uniref:uncharacterized protein isoform X2 n=1 Tax=Stichopus japonicus TaxID=307972 RepID=UPI003AB2C8CF
MSSSTKDEKPSSVSTRRLRRIRPAPQAQSCCEEQAQSGLKERTHDDKHSVLESDRRRRRRESDARCRANLSSCFSFLRSQVQDKNENEVKMSKEALLYHSIDQVQYLEAILVLLQQSKETSLGTTPSQPVEVLQGIHKEFISKKHGAQAEQLVLNRNSTPESSQRVSRTAVSDPHLQACTSKQPAVSRKSTHPTTPKMASSDPTAANMKGSKRTIPNILVKKADSKTPTKSQRCKETLKQKKAQLVPGTPTHGGRSGNGDKVGLEVQKVPCTPTKAFCEKEDHLGIKHYCIKGKDITPTKLKATHLCDNCELQDLVVTDLNCYEDPGDWSTESFDKLLHTPQRNQHDDSVLFRTPKMKRKSLTSPTDSHSSGKRSRKCLFKIKSRRDEKNSKKKTKKEKECSPPKKSRYFKRATAARTRAWDPVALKVTSPFQPYSGIYGQRKKLKSAKAPTRSKGCSKSQKKMITAVGLGPALTQEISVTDGGATVDHTRTSKFFVSPLTNDALNVEAEEEAKCSQDSLSIAEVPSLPADICKLISRDGAFYLEEVKDSDSTSPHLNNSLDVERSPSDAFPGNTSQTDISSMESFASQQGGMTFDPMSHSAFQNDSVDDYEQSVNIRVMNQARAIYESVSSDICLGDGRKVTGEGVGMDGSPSQLFTDSQGLSSLDGLIKRNVWQGKRNQDITLAQLQRQPIFGTHNSVYSSPQWMSTIASRLQVNKETEWVDIESSSSGPLSSGQQESWDTTDFLSSIDNGSGQSQFSRSSSQNSTDSSFSVMLEPGCAAARAIEEYQVVPLYRPEE